jgi:hypothetical protein
MASLSNSDPHSLSATLAYLHLLELIGLAGFLFCFDTATLNRQSKKGSCLSFVEFNRNGHDGTLRSGCPAVEHIATH